MRVGIRLVAAALMFVAVGCGSSGSGGYNPTPNPTPTPTPTPGAGTVNIVGESGNRSFNPNPSSLPANGMITFTNTHSVTHHIVANDGSWNTGDLPPGASSAAISSSGWRIELPLLDSPDDGWRGERLEWRHAAVHRPVLLTSGSEASGDARWTRGGHRAGWPAGPNLEFGPTNPSNPTNTS